MCLLLQFVRVVQKLLLGSYSSYGSHSSSSGGAGGRAMHERSHSDTPTPLPSVALSAESSSVTSLSNMPLRKTHTSGKSCKFIIKALYSA